MDPHEPFLKAIVANRHDDLPRLVYADFLEETGEPNHVARAHFIRTQIALETIDPKSALFSEMKALEARVLDYYLEEWRFELPEQVRFGPELDKVKWRRGFPDDLGPMRFDEFCSFGAGALREMPLTSLHLIERTGLVNFNHFPEFGQISRLSLSIFLPPTHTSAKVDPSTLSFDSFVSAPVFAALRHFDLSENHITDAWLVRFAFSYPTTSFAPTLESLDLSRNFGITDAGANVLATAPGLDGLKKLVVRDTGVTKAGLAMLRKRFGDRLA